MESSGNFGDPSLFEEFEKSTEKDGLLLSKLKDEREEIVMPLKHARDSDDWPTVDDEFFAASNSQNGEEGSESGSSGSDYEDDENRPPTASIKTSTLLGAQSSSDERLQLQKLSKEVLELRRENIRLKEKTRVVDPTVHWDKGEGPGIEVIFFNQDFARTYRSEIESYVSNLWSQFAEEVGHLPPVGLRPNNVPLSTQADLLLSDKAISYINASTVLGCSQFYREFVVDALGWPLVDSTPALTDGWGSTRYEASFKTGLPTDEEEEPDDLYGPAKKESFARLKSSCFNCDGDHRISDCPEPRNQTQIAKRSAEFKQAKANMPAFQKQVRYHQDDGVLSEGGGGRFSQFKPGVLSDDLREALGLRSHQLAPFVYQMRNLGYPPGWLEEARSNGNESGLAMFGSDGQDMPNESLTEKENMETNDDAEVDPDLEDGQVAESSSDRSSSPCDTSKIISFPGFNCPCEEGVQDEWQALQMLPMQDKHSKEATIKLLLSTGSQSKKRSRSEDEGPSKKKMKKAQNDSDMDISSQDDDMDDEEARTIAELREHQRRLQEQLGDDATGPTDMKPPLPSTPQTGDRPPLPPGTPPVTPIAAPPELAPCTPANTTASHGSSLQMTPGTPVLQEISFKGDSLPDADKWADGIIEHIPYENLPGATGTFEKLRKTLASIREAKKK